MLNRSLGWVLASGVLLACSGQTTRSGPSSDAGTAGAGANGATGGMGGGGAGGSGARAGQGGAAGNAGQGGGPNDGGSDDYDLRHACTISSGYAGDERCLSAPGEADGFQLHYGPRSYDDPADVAPFLILPGEEVSDCVYVRIPYASDVFFREHHIRARPGAHYVAAYVTSATFPNPDALPDSCAQSTPSRLLVAAVGSAGGLVFDVPPRGTTDAPENSGVAFGVQAESVIALMVHFVNTTAEPQLREAWFNFHFKPPSEVAELLELLEIVPGVGMVVPPMTRQRIGSQSCSPPAGAGAIRVLNLMTHLHAHTTSASVWKTDASGARTLVYQAFDWASPLIAHYDSLYVNPTPDAGSMRSGALSGILTIATGESLSVECEVDNTTDQTLTFGDRAYTDARCDLLGVYGPSAGGTWRCVDF